jgi:hypothetical protein
MYVYIYMYFVSLGTHFLPSKETYVRYILINYSLYHGVHCTTLLKCEMQQNEDIKYHFFLILGGLSFVSLQNYWKEFRSISFEVVMGFLRYY